MEMRVCRTCLQELPNDNFYSIDEIEENSEASTDSNTLKLGKMIEKCIPEMDIEICDSPIICENCCKLLKNAYKFRNICIPTEEKIYQYIEKNSLRLGESIDLNNLSEKHWYKHKDIPLEETDIKKENDIPIESEDEMPVLHPEMELTKKHHNRQLIIKLSRISHIVEENLDSKQRRISKNSAQDTLHSYSLQSEDSNVDPKEISKYKKRPINCNKCQYRTHKLILLKKHLKKCSGKIYKCDECSYSSVRLRKVKAHKWTHTNPEEKKTKIHNGRVLCGVCKNSYYKWYMKIHMLRKHQPFDDLPFKCQEEGCEYSCPRQVDLTAHMVSHIKGPTYFCRVCHKWSYTTKCELLSHEKNCTGNKKRKKNQFS